MKTVCPINWAATISKNDHFPLAKYEDLAADLKMPDIESYVLPQEGFVRINAVLVIIALASFDLDASLFFQKKRWLGLSFRSAFAAFNTQGPKQSSQDSFDLWMSL